MSYLYGEIIEEKIGNKEECPLRENQHKNCDSCYGPKGCKLSFTQFEYEYAKLINKPIIVIYNTNYNSDEAFSQANQIYIEQYKGKDCKKAYYRLQEKNDVFISDVILKHSYSYSSHEDFINACTLAVESAKNCKRLIFQRRDNAISFLHNGSQEMRASCPISIARMKRCKHFTILWRIDNASKSCYR